MARRKDKPFIGVDGEGGGTDQLGRQNYLLLRAGGRVLENKDGSPLRTLQILNFICDLPDTAIYVGFGFDYDATQILRDMAGDRRDLLFLTEMERARLGRQLEYVAFREFDVALRPGNYFRVRRLHAEPNGAAPRRGVKGSARTIWDVRGNFQGPFVDALASYDIGTKAQRDAMQAVKNQRNDFKRMTREIRRYNKMECDFLARLMERVREFSYAAPDGGIHPVSWNGAGKFGQALLKSHQTPRLLERMQDAPAKKKRDYPIIALPPLLLRHANAGYFGGRFEINGPGFWDAPVWEVDINSAYPAQMLKLPCLVHGTWKELQPGEKPRRGSLYIAEIKYRHDCAREPIWSRAGASLHEARSPGVKRVKGPRLEQKHFCGLPHRDKFGRLQFRLEGMGSYWSVEIEAAKALGLRVVSWWGGFQYEKRCDCKPFDWIPPYYGHRKRLELRRKGAGQPLKLGLNAMYGKLVQRAGGGGPYTNHVWGGLITAGIRAELLKAAAQNPSAVVMMATDAIYMTAPPSLPLGEALGQWEQTLHEDGIFIVQPGVYWPIGSSKKMKMRGLPRRLFTPEVKAQFETAWLEFLSSGVDPSRSHAALPIVPITVPNFIGLRLAAARGKHELAGRWMDETRNLDFAFTGKRVGGVIEGRHVTTRPIRGAIDDPTITYEAKPLVETLFDELEKIFEALPDFLDVRPF